MANEQLHPLTVERLVHSEQEETALLVLRDVRQRALEIPIGLCEALAIQVALDGEQTPRPFTHDLMLSISQRLEAKLSRVVIDDFSGGTYYARLILNGPENPISLDCRPSDGVALALRANVPVLATDAVLDSAAG